MKTQRINLYVSIILCLIIGSTSCKKTNDDNIPPEITMLGSNPIYTELDSPYVDPGATAYDDTDGDITDKINTIMDVNINVPGDFYYVYYNVTDEAGNEAVEKKRRVKVQTF
ncbi:DUF5011 domain-containing protein [Bacteroidota bacterium]